MLASLKNNTHSIIQQILSILTRERFFDYQRDITSQFRELELEVNRIAQEFIQVEKENFQNKVRVIQNNSKYSILSQDSKQSIGYSLQKIQFDFPSNLDGIQSTLHKITEGAFILTEIENRIEQEINQIIEEQNKPAELEQNESQYIYVIKTKDFPTEIKTEQELNDFIEMLEQYRSSLQKNIVIKLV